MRENPVAGDVWSLGLLPWVLAIGWVLIASHKQQYDAQSTKLAQRLRRLVEEPAA